VAPYFDVYSGEIIAVGSNVRRVLEALNADDFGSRVESIVLLAEETSSDLVMGGLKAIESLRAESDVLKSMPADLQLIPRKLPADDSEINLSHMSLCVTMECNFRCEYCSYSGGFEQERAHKPLAMTTELAFRAIDVFLNHTKEEQPALTFYGGEPLLEKRLIKECIAYASKKHDRMFFVVTTNGSLLDSETLTFFEEHNVTCFVSFDGPKHIQDMGRMFASGGETYDRVIANLENAARTHEKYFRKKIIIHATTVLDNEFEKTADFFANHPVLNNLKLSVGLRNAAYLNESASALLKKTKHSLNSVEPAKQRFIEALSNGKLNLNRADHFIFNRMIRSILDRQRSPFSKNWMPGGNCNLGEFRMLTDPFGDFYICEKTCRTPVVGNVHNGIDLDAMRKIEEDFLSTCDPCYKCWTIRSCTICYQHIYYHGIEQDKKDRICEQSRRNHHWSLRLIAETLEKYPRAFEDYTFDDESRLSRL
jgi:uncharacterized protein